MAWVPPGRFEVGEEIDAVKQRAAEAPAVAGEVGFRATAALAVPVAAGAGVGGGD